MNWLNYHHLYYFYVIASEGGVTQATYKLKLAQSTLSAQLKQFEEVIGYRLFERKHRRLELTDVGKKVYEYAHEIFSLGEELIGSLGDFQNSLSYSIKVGVMDSVPKKISRQMVNIAAKENKARITIFEESLTSLCKKLASHEIDLILSNDKPHLEGDTARFHAKLVGNLKVSFLASKEDEHLKETLPRSLHQHPIIMPGFHSPLRFELMEHFKIKHVEPIIVAEVDDLELQKMLILDGHGVGALPLVACEEELRSGELITLSETPICHENLWIVTNHRLVHNPISKLLIEKFRPHDEFSY